MRKSISFLLTICFLSLFSQNDDCHFLAGIFVEDLPKLGVDLDSLFLSEIKHPLTNNNDTVITVVVEFWIDTCANTTQHKIVKGEHELLNKEAIRIAKLVTFKTPAKVMGRPVMTPFYLPFRIMLKDSIR